MERMQYRSELYIMINELCKGEIIYHSKNGFKVDGMYDYILIIQKSIYIEVSLMLLKNKICLVTGAGKGIGRSILDAFLQEGAFVYANDCVEGSLDEYISILM